MEGLFGLHALCPLYIIGELVKEKLLCCSLPSPYSRALFNALFPLENRAHDARPACGNAGIATRVMKMTMNDVDGVMGGFTSVFG